MQAAMERGEAAYQEKERRQAGITQGQVLLEQAQREHDQQYGATADSEVPRLPPPPVASAADQIEGFAVWFKSFFF